jgi:1-acyl-sn-glycerol-3-phosphate acyltransferase
VLLESRRGSAIFRSGDRPVKIDWEGKSLEGKKREEFAAKRAANSRGERVVIPLRIKGHWLLFEALDQAPKLPDDVRAILSPEELAKFKREWLELEAELWARQLEKDLPEPVPEAASSDASAAPVSSGPASRRRPRGSRR